MVQVGDHLPEGQLVEFIETEGGKFCPTLLDVSDSVKGKRIAILAVPTAFHPDYLKQAEACKQAGAEEIWCIGVNDPMAMGKWNRGRQ